MIITFCRTVYTAFYYFLIIIDTHVCTHTHLSQTPSTQVSFSLLQIQRKRKSPIQQNSSGEPSYIPTKQRKITPTPASSITSVLSPEHAVATAPRPRRVAAPGKTKPPKTLSNGQIDMTSVSWAALSPVKDVKRSKSATGWQGCSVL